MDISTLRTFYIQCSKVLFVTAILQIIITYTIGLFGFGFLDAIVGIEFLFALIALTTIGIPLCEPKLIQKDIEYNPDVVYSMLRILVALLVFACCTNALRRESNFWNNITQNRPDYLPQKVGSGKVLLEDRIPTGENK